MTRRHRRYTRRRGGWGRHEPVPLLLVPDDDRTLGEVIAACGRLLYRYRSELAPLAAAALVVGLGAWLHAHHPTWWPLPLLLTIAAVTGLVLAPARWATWWAVLGRREERVYAGAVAIIVGGWLTAATAAGPGSGPLPTLATVGALLGTLPWWAHHRRRARVRVERSLEAWPEIAEAVGLAGSRILSAVVDRWGFTARLALRRGQAAKTAIEAIPAIESGLAARPGAVRVEPDPARADRVILRVIDTDPHAQPIPWPNPAASSITRPIEIGLWEDGTPVRVLLLRRHALIGGVIGSGKSGVLNVLLAVLTGCPDALLWGVDLKQGMELGRGHRVWGGWPPPLPTPWRCCGPR